MKLCQWTNGLEAFRTSVTQGFLVWANMDFVLSAETGFEMFLPAAFFWFQEQHCNSVSGDCFSCKPKYVVVILEFGYCTDVHNTLLFGSSSPPKKDLTSSLRSMAANSDDEMPQSPRHLTIKVHRLSGGALRDLRDRALRDL